MKDNAWAPSRTSFLTPTSSSFPSIMASSPLKTPFGFNPIPSSPVPADVPLAEKSALAGMVDQAKEAFAKVNKFRDDLKLPNPGTYEGINREVKRKKSHRTDGI